MLDWYRRLIGLRHEHPGLRDGRRPTVRSEAGAGWIALDRDGVSVVANLGRDGAIVPWPGGGDGAGWKVAAQSTERVQVISDGISLPPRSAAIMVADGTSGRG
jgi:hypothetical protein